MAVSDWQAGKGWQQREGVSRVVVPPEYDLALADWSFAVGLDVLLVTGRLATPQRVAEVAAALDKVAALNSLWMERHDGVSGEPIIAEAVVLRGGLLVPGLEWFPAQQLARRVIARRECNALLGEGPFRTAPQFRNALLAQLAQMDEGARTVIDWAAVWRGEIVTPEGSDG
ncbi:hypothetical protein ACPRNU_01020 [Chromobacterium vaccinii]|uniref:hypothetical protein n=1 Tax=Chromobacterium vaccinii TaxID=1108595 RepID=UPI003C747469